MKKNNAGVYYPRPLRELPSTARSITRAGHRYYPPTAMGSMGGGIATPLPDFKHEIRQKQGLKVDK